MLYFVNNKLRIRNHGPVGSIPELESEIEISFQLSIRNAVGIANRSGIHRIHESMNHSGELEIPKFYSVDQVDVDAG